MQLKLLDIDEFINSKRIKQVTSSAIPSKSYDSAGLWSEMVFGRVGSNERKKFFGYVDLKTKLIHPTAYNMIKTISPIISSILNEKKSYVFKDGNFVNDEDNGTTGIGLLLQHFYDIKFIDIAKPDKLEVARFIDDNKSKLLIDKWIIMPAAIRDIDISKPGMRTIAEINTYYRSLLYLSGMISGDVFIDGIVLGKMQKTLQDIVKWIQTSMKGKQGLFRNNILKKTVDFSTRLVLSSSPTIKLGYIGLPWFTLISIYEPLFTYRVKSAHKDFEESILTFLKMNSGETVDARVMTKFVTKVNAYPTQVSSLMQHQIKEILAEFMDDQVVAAKRDPAISRNSWFSAKPVIIDHGVALTNSLDLGPITGDCVTGDVMLFEIIDDNIKEFTLDISKFADRFKCTHIRTTTRDDGIIVKEYTVVDNVYTRGIDVNTGQLRYSKIHKWWVHENLEMFNVELKKSISGISQIDPFECSKDLSLIGFNPDIQEFEKFSPTDISESSKTMMIKDNRVSPTSISTFDKLKDYGICDLELFASELDLEPSNFSSKIAENIMNQNQAGELEIIPVSKLKVTKSSTTTAYDFTVDPDQQSFITASKLIVKNSDGDTLQVVPLFTEETKKTATEKMNPTKSIAKWKDVAKPSNLTYSLSLDAIAAVFHATEF